MLDNVTVRLVRGGLTTMRAAHFCIRRTLSGSILLYDVHTELAYIMSGFNECVKVNDSLIFLQIWADMA